jgi:hypothetical protein
MRWISEQLKARWMLHALDQGAIEGVMDITSLDQGAVEGVMDVTCDGSWRNPWSD